eukprot:scaffold1108_cov260-Pinguiococcus_pyrenoidosus.AAC.1
MLAGVDAKDSLLRCHEHVLHPLPTHIEVSYRDICGDVTAHLSPNHFREGVVRGHYGRTSRQKLGENDIDYVANVAIRQRFLSRDFYGVQRCAGHFNAHLLVAHESKEFSRRVRVGHPLASTSLHDKDPAGFPGSPDFARNRHLERRIRSVGQLLQDINVRQYKIFTLGEDRVLVHHVAGRRLPGEFHDAEAVSVLRHAGHWLQEHHFFGYSCVPPMESVVQKRFMHRMPDNRRDHVRFLNLAEVKMHDGVDAIEGVPHRAVSRARCGDERVLARVSVPHVIVQIHQELLAVLVVLRPSAIAALCFQPVSLRWVFPQTTRPERVFRSRAFRTKQRQLRAELVRCRDARISPRGEQLGLWLLVVLAQKLLDASPLLVDEDLYLSRGQQIRSTCVRPSPLPRSALGVPASTPGEFSHCLATVGHKVADLGAAHDFAFLIEEVLRCFRTERALLDEVETRKALSSPGHRLGHGHVRDSLKASAPRLRRHRRRAEFRCAAFRSTAQSVPKRNSCA